MRRYETMFLFDNAVARDWAAIEQEVRRLLDRIGAELLVCVKFDERKLAYEINRRKRGTYVLAYMDAPAERIGDLERDVQLSELVLRVLVLRAEGLTEERLTELRARSPEEALVPAGDGRRHDEFGGPERRRPRERESDARPDRREGRSADERTPVASRAVAAAPVAEPAVPADKSASPATEPAAPMAEPAMPMAEPAMPVTEPAMPVDAPEPPGAADEPDGLTPDA